MAFINVHITTFVILVCILNIYGKLCHGNVTDSSIAGVDNISINLFEIEHGTGSFHFNDDRIIDTTSANYECIHKSNSLPMNGTGNNTMDNYEHSVATAATTEQVNDVSNTNQNDQTNVNKTHMNIGFGEMQMIQHDREATQQRLIEILLYMYDNYTSSTETTCSGQVPVECTLQHELCAYWAARGECEARLGTCI